MVPPGGELTDEIVEQALELVLHTGDLSGDKGLKFTNLTADTDYYWLAAAFTIVETDDANEVVLCSDVSKGEFHTPQKTCRNLLSRLR